MNKPEADAPGKKKPVRIDFDSWEKVTPRTPKEYLSETKYSAEFLYAGIHSCYLPLMKAQKHWDITKIDRGTIKKCGNS